MKEKKEVYFKGYRFRGKTNPTEHKRKLRTDLTGKRFGRAVVIECLGRAKHGYSWWGLRCDCGTLFASRSRELMRGHTQSCGCLGKEKLQHGKNKLPLGHASRNELFASYKKSASTRGYAFELSADEFNEIISGDCVYCGAKADRERKPNKGVNGGFMYTGIDRIDNSKGYIKGNVVSCCWTCNRAKGSGTIGDFEKWINQMVKYRSARFEFGETPKKY